jgi:hypothetical protein
MRSLGKGVRCTVHDGSIWIHLDKARVNIPSNILNKSQILMNILSDDTAANGDFVMAVPKEWLRAWAACFCSEGKLKSLRCTDTRDLIKSLLACF